jgi:hypothetical protein
LKIPEAIRCLDGEFSVDIGTFQTVSRRDGKFGNIMMPPKRGIFNFMPLALKPAYFPFGFQVPRSCGNLSHAAPAQTPGTYEIHHSVQQISAHTPLSSAGLYLHKITPHAV